MFPPGRELDALVAERVMGWDCNAYFVERPGRKHYFDPDKGTFYLYEQWCPSEEITAAWEVVIKLGGDVRIEFDRRATEPWQVFFRIENVSHAYGLTAPHAICLAALMCVSKTDVFGHPPFKL